MNMIELSSNQKSDVTVISNLFIDIYMPVANGSFVKVYLYLLRCLSSADVSISVSGIADHLEDSEKDILRALSYWEKVNLISLEQEASGEITGITIHDIIDEKNNKKENTAQTEPIPAADAAKTPTAGQTDKPTYSQTQIAKLTENEEVKWLLKIIEVYLERFLKPADIQLILYLYESIGFSAELIMYLYEYCVSKNKKNSSYIEAVALSWAENGIDTVEKAEAEAAIYNTNYSAVNKAFGLNRTPGNVEKQYMNKWTNQFGFQTDIIIEACDRTILMTQKPDFKYADKILENWYHSGVHHLSDIKKLDQEHVRATVKTPPAAPKPSNNKFNAFPQRNYTAEDYSSMEQRLLGNTKQ